MSLPEDWVRLRHMWDHSVEAANLVEGVEKPEFDGNRLLQLGLTRLVEIIGEAAARVSPQGRAAFPQIPWADVVGMRNKLIHGYDQVDPTVLWDTITMDLPTLIAQLRAILEEAPSP